MGLCSWAAAGGPEPEPPTGRATCVHEHDSLSLGREAQPPLAQSVGEREDAVKRGFVERIRETALSLEVPRGPGHITHEARGNYP